MSIFLVIHSLSCLLNDSMIFKQWFDTRSLIFDLFQTPALYIHKQCSQRINITWFDSSLLVISELDINKHLLQCFKKKHGLIFCALLNDQTDLRYNLNDNVVILPHIESPFQVCYSVQM